MKSRKFNMQELIMLNSAMDLYTKKFGNSENSENLKNEIVDQLIDKVNTSPFKSI
tara:strand:- start:35 stop:199 length:165 start_codon:yes stop_codon:yes gene_type:complete